MIKTIIFDFGDVFVNLDKQATYRELKDLGINSFSEEMTDKNKLYETGKISSTDFVSFYHEIFPNTEKKQLEAAWNAIILDFPEHRLEFIEALKKSNHYQLVLLSNTNELHIEKVIENMGNERYIRFKNSFHQFYLSHEIQLRKPESDIYQFVLDSNSLKAEECLFIDDTFENTEAAKKLGIHVWNNNPLEDDIVNLFQKKKDIFELI
ncbi:MAG: HAD family phosphatase [Flavobacteriaceae bacterium]|nr:HAD family phosphatase [Flavobacteriaceae bacterium]